MLDVDPAAGTVIQLSALSVSTCFGNNMYSIDWSDMVYVFAVCDASHLSLFINVKNLTV